MKKSNKKEPKQCTLHSVIPRIKQFKCEHGYIYDTFSDEILIEIVDGYTRYYVIDYGYERNYLTPELYGA